MGTLALAILTVAVEPLWRRARRVIQVTHEAGHALLLTVSGHWIREIAIHDKGGGTRANRKPWWPLDVMNSFIGYITPPLVGLLLALGVDRGWNPRTVIAVFMVILVGGVLLNGDWLGLLVMVGTGLVLAYFYWVAGTSAQVGLLIALAWFLLLGGFRRILEIAAKPAADSSDHKHLHELTEIPPLVWTAVWFAISAAALVTGARVLLKH